MIVDIIKEHLEGFSAITSLVGSRIYPDYLPQSLDLRSNSPTISLFLVDNTYDHDLAGDIATVTGRVQVDSWSYYKADVITLANTIRILLDGLQHRTYSNVRVAWVRLLDERDLNEAPEDGSSDWLFRRMQDFQVIYTFNALTISQGGLELSAEEVA